jgi:Zn-dependent M32 family carboxypeptidase
MSKENKSNELQVEQRMNRVFELMLYEHLSYNEFKEKAAKEFSITTRQAENLWKEARVRLKERFERNSEEILQDHLNQLYDLLKRSREDRNKRVEREVLADIAKIQSLEGVKKVDITTNGQPISININLD